MVFSSSGSPRTGGQVAQFVEHRTEKPAGDSAKSDKNPAFSWVFCIFRGAFVPDFGRDFDPFATFPGTIRDKEDEESSALRFIRLGRPTPATPYR